MNPGEGLCLNFTTTRPHWAETVLFWFADFKDFLTPGNLPKDFDTYSATFDSLMMTRAIEMGMRDEAGK